MHPLRSLLPALMLPALLLPDGMTYCLRRLLGEPTERTCCASCCSKHRAPLDRPSFTPDRCIDCCVAMPPTGRSIEPTAKRASDQLRDAAMPVACVLPEPIAEPMPRALPSLTRAHRSLAPPPIALLSLPLRL